MAFLKETELKEVLEETGIEYVNIAEEVLANRTVDDKTVKKVVEKQYPPVFRKELYKFLPEKVYKLWSGVINN